jgi:hypothetical protein
MQSNSIAVLHRVKAVMFALLYLYLDKPLYIKKVGSEPTRLICKSDFIKEQSSSSNQLLYHQLLKIKAVKFRLLLW